jgi:hypothetical protein
MSSPIILRLSHAAPISYPHDVREA